MSEPASPPPADDTSSGEVSPFAALGLPQALVDAVTASGYTDPTPIQTRTIPALLEGRDVIGQAQTGTGKTAAFALPILARLSGDAPAPQALVLAPTRELALQVTESFETYAKKLRGVRVATLYGGASFPVQFRALAARPAIVVGTPGRVIDHLERGSLDLSALRWLVLDEADEMLRMGFFEDVTRIIESAPESRSMVLFSATLPARIRDIARAQMKDPVEVRIETKQLTAATVRQLWIPVRSHERFAALGRLFETEPVDGALVFVRTKAAAAELANNLAANGISAAPLSGDLSQPMREATVERLKNGELDVIVATDVAARGLDVERITHVINYDKPFDAESYVHRIGRTGRAGREGTAILFVQHRDRHVLGAIERTTGQRLEEMEPPSSDDINQVRVTQFKERMTAAMESDELALYARLIDEWCRETGNSELDAAVALAAVAQRGEPLLLPPDPPRRPARARMDFGRNDQGRGRGGPRRDGPHRDGPHRGGPRRDGPNNDNAERGADTRGPDTRGSQARGPQRKDEGPARAADTRGPGETAPPRRKPVGAQQHVVDDRPADGTGPARRKSSGKPPGKPAKPRTKTASKAGAKPRKRPSAKAGAKAGGAAKPPPKPHRKGKKPS